MIAIAPPITPQIEPVLQEAGITLIRADVIEGLKQLRSNSIGSIVTSPPYFQMVDYEVEGQLGREKMLALYLGKMLAVARELYRVMAEHTCMAMVIGDTSNNYSPVYSKGKERSGDWSERRPVQDAIVGGVAKKLLESADLIVPWKLYIAMMEEAGFIPIGYLFWKKKGGGNRQTKFVAADGEPILLFMKQSKGRRANPAYFLPFKSMFVEHPVVSDDIHRCPYPATLARELLSHIHPVKLGLPTLDPFVGSGTTAYTAYQMNIPAIGIDLETDRAIELCKAAIAGTLKPAKASTKAVGICPQKKSRANPTPSNRKRPVSGWTEPAHRDIKGGTRTDWYYRWLVQGRQRPCIRLKNKEVKEAVDRLIAEGKTVKEIRAYLGDGSD